METARRRGAGAATAPQRAASTGRRPSDPYMCETEGKHQGTAKSCFVPKAGVTLTNMKQTASILLCIKSWGDPDKYATKQASVNSNQKVQCI